MNYRVNSIKVTVKSLLLERLFYFDFFPRVFIWLTSGLEQFFYKLSFPWLIRWIFKMNIVWKLNHDGESCCTYRVTHKKWDFRDDCTKCILIVSLCTGFSKTANFSLSYPNHLISHLRLSSMQKIWYNLGIVLGSV